jgi:hypothetical protein
MIPVPILEIATTFSSLKSAFLPSCSAIISPETAPTAPLLQSLPWIFAPAQPRAAWATLCPISPRFALLVPIILAPLAVEVVSMLFARLDSRLSAREPPLMAVLTVVVMSPRHHPK